MFKNQRAKIRGYRKDVAVKRIAVMCSQSKAIKFSLDTKQKFGLDSFITMLSTG